VITVAYLRLMGEDVRCYRCGLIYRQVQPARAPLLGETWVHCPRCESEARHP
jgi:uncharacterized C2H2 Zn-finger protein